MADNTLGSGYLSSAKPFNVINPTGIDPGQAVDILKEVSENARNRAFQAQEGARDRQAKASMASQELQARSQSEDKDRSSRENLTREQMKQQQGQFDAEQAAAQMQHDQEMDLNRQQFQSEEKYRQLTVKMNYMQEKAALQEQATEDRINAIRGFRSTYGPSASLPSDGAPAGMGGDVLGAVDELPEEDRQRLADELEGAYEQKRKLSEKQAALLFVQTLSNKAFLSGKDADGTSLLSRWVTALTDEEGARAKQASDIQSALDVAVNDRLTIPTFVDDEGWWGSMDRGIRAATGLSMRGPLGIPSPLPVMKGSSGDTFDERYENSKWEDAGLQPPDTRAVRGRRLAQEVARVVSPKDTATVTPVVESIFENLEKAVGASGKDREGYVTQARENYKALLDGGLVDPQALDFAMKQVWTIASKKTVEVKKGVAQANADNPPSEGDEPRLSFAEKVKQGETEAQEAKLLRDAMELFRDFQDDEVGKDGVKTGKRVSLVKHWFEGDAVLEGKRNTQAIVKGISALAGTDDPLAIMTLLSDDDPNNDMGSSELLAAFKDIPMDARRKLRDVVEEHYFSIRGAMMQQGLDLERFTPGIIRDELKALEGQVEKPVADVTRKINQRGAAVRKQKEAAIFKEREASRAERGRTLDQTYEDFLGGGS